MSEKYFKDIPGDFLGLIGNPCRQSLSPLLHHIFCREAGLSLPYLTEEPKEGELQALIEGLSTSKCRGLNVTVPYKEKIIPYLSGTEPLAAAVGAVNTLLPAEGGFQGYNTDVFGFTKALEELGISPADEKVLILGAGGAARAVIYALLSEGAEVDLWNRSRERAQALCEQFWAYGAILRVINPDELIPEDYSLIVSTLPIEAENSFLSAFPSFGEKISAKVISIAYSARISPLEAICEAKKLFFCGGLPMLFYQGLKSFEIWTGISFPEERVKAMKQEFSEKASCKLILTGFMGAGKTSLGRKAAEELGRPFYDTDRIIELRSGLSVRQIFEQKGEAYFRSLEKDILNELLSSPEAPVIALGGGTVTDPDNRKRLMEAPHFTVWLKCSPKSMQRRLRFKSDRPLLKGKNRSELIELSASREAFYREISDAELMTERSISRNTKELIRLWKQFMF